MSWRFRRSTQLFPGVRLTMTKTGLGLSVGGHGLRYSMHSSGRRTVSAGFPGTGLYWTDSWYDPKQRRPDATHPIASLSDLQQPDAAKLASALSGGFPPERGLIDSAVASTEGQASDELIALRPLPGFELLVPRRPDTTQMLIACHLLAADQPREARRLLADLPDSEERVLLECAVANELREPAAVLAHGTPVLDSPTSWLIGLLRVCALNDCKRWDEVLELVDALEDSPALELLGDDARDMLLIERSRTLLSLNQPADAAEWLAEVISRDPLDVVAVRLLARAHSLLEPSSSSGITIHDDSHERQRLRLVVSSLEHELAAARLVLAGIVEELTAVANEQDVHLGQRLSMLSRLKLRLAERIAEVSGNPEDERQADQLRADADEEDRRRDDTKQQRERERERERAEPEGESPAQSAGVDAAELKSLYRALTKRWHPDRASSPEDAELRTEMMARINAAYTRGDIDELRRMLALGADALKDQTDGSVAGLEALIARLREELRETRNEAEALLASPLEDLRVRLSSGEEVFAVLAAALDAEIEELTQALDELDAA